MKTAARWTFFVIAGLFIGVGVVWGAVGVCLVVGRDIGIELVEEVSDWLLS